MESIVDPVCFANPVSSDPQPMQTGGQTNSCMGQGLLTDTYKEMDFFLQNASFSKSEVKHGPRLGSEYMVIGLFWHIEYATPMRF